MCHYLLEKKEKNNDGNQEYWVGKEYLYLLVHVYYAHA